MDGGGALTIDRLYSLPRLIGTAPKGAAWAPDGRRFAFLWNDEGTNFYDVWMATVDTLTPVRVTRMPRLDPPPAPADDAAAARRREARIEADAGVGAVAWHPDGRRLVFALRGDLFVVTPGGEPRRIDDGAGASRAFQLAPDGRSAVFLPGGDVWTAPLEGAGAARRLTGPARDNAVSVERFELSPDGSSLAAIETDVSRVPERRIPDYLLGGAAGRRTRRGGSISSSCRRDTLSSPSTYEAAPATARCSGGRIPCRSSNRLIALGKDVDLVVLPDAGHGWDLGPLYETRFAVEKMIDHFDRPLGRGPR